MIILSGLAALFLSSFNTFYRSENDGEEMHWFVAKRTHSVRLSGIEIDAVALVQGECFLSYHSTVLPTGVGSTHTMKGSAFRPRKPLAKL